MPPGSNQRQDFNIIRGVLPVAGTAGRDGRQRGKIGGVVTGAIPAVEIGARFNPALKLAIPSRPSRRIA